MSQKHLSILENGVETWNKWRSEHPNIKPDLSGESFKGANLAGLNLDQANLEDSDFSSTNLKGATFAEASLERACLERTNFEKAWLAKANLRDAKLDYSNLQESALNKAIFSEASLKGAKLNFSDCSLAGFYGARLSSADFSDARLIGVNFNSASLRGANLSRTICFNSNFMDADLAESFLRNANFDGANFRNADLTSADLVGANLESSILVETVVEGALLNNCRVYGASVWNLIGNVKQQNDLIVTPIDSHDLMVDNIEVAQLIYLLLENKKLRNVIDTITSKSVLIIGRFSESRKPVLNRLKELLRQKGYLPIMFDFEKPYSRDIQETIKIILGLSRFVVADITDARSVLQELGYVVPQFPSIPVKLIIQASELEYGMLDHLRQFPWVLETFEYENERDLEVNLLKEIIIPSEKKVIKLTKSSS